MMRPQGYPGMPPMPQGMSPGKGPPGLPGVPPGAAGMRPMWVPGKGWVGPGGVVLGKGPDGQLLPPGVQRRDLSPHAGSRAIKTQLLLGKGKGAAGDEKAEEEKGKSRSRS